MKVSLAAAQYPVHYHNSFEDWKSHTATWVQHAARSGAQWLLFPEYGSLELVSLLSKAEQSDLPLQLIGIQKFCADFCQVFSDLARQHEVVIVAPSFPVRAEHDFVNRCFVFGPKGQMGYQDKLFMTRFELEEWGVQAALPRLCVFESDWGCFGVQICYDIEFPIGAAWLCQAGAQVILAPSCTETIRGATRVHVGARARALEQQCYTVVSPLVGDAPWSPAVDINFGYAACYSTPDKFFPEEGILKTMPPQESGWLVCPLDLSLLESVRENGQTLNFKSQQAISFAFQGTAFEMVKMRI